MGTTLYDGETGAALWGFEDPLDYVRLWGTGSNLRKLRLKVTKEGVVSRPVTVGEPIQAPAWAPWAKGLFGYSKLIERARDAVVLPEAVGTFGYDWRLSVEHNARELARAARKHLETWRKHEVHQQGPRRPMPRLVLVAHSMGGLLARALPLVEAKGEDPVNQEVRAIITLGTPFQGAVNSVMMLAKGEEGPRLMKRSRLQKLAITLPGVYALLPTYRCVPVSDGNGKTTDVRRVNPDDIRAIGGNRRLAREAIAFAEQLRSVHVPGHVASVGIHQPTLHTVHFRGGKAVAFMHDYEWVDGELLLDDYGSVAKRERYGDSTVPQDTAMTEGANENPIAQHHGALPVTKECIDSVNYAITKRKPGVRLGEGEFGIDVPDQVSPGESWPITIRNLDSAKSAELEVVDLATDRVVHNPGIVWVDGSWQARAKVPAPGLYEVRLTGGSASAVRQVVLAANDDE